MPRMKAHAELLRHDDGHLGACPDIAAKAPRCGALLQQRGDARAVGRREPGRWARVDGAVLLRQRCGRAPAIG